MIIKTTMKKVSVIVPVYNVENYITKCLESLVSQTLQDMEIIIVNDGSTDNSQQIIDNFVKKYPEKIKAFIKDNGGLSDARNFGIDRAIGEFIGFVDSDDYVTPTMFEQMYLLGKKNNAEMVICNLQKVNELGEITQKLCQIPNMPERIDIKQHFSIFADLSYFACNKIFKKELFDEKKFREGLHFEDIELIPQLLLKCKTIAQTQEYHYQYFERENSISKTHTQKGLDILEAIKSVERAFKKSDYKEEKTVLKNFCILEGIYTFLAYLAFVKNRDTYKYMSSELQKFIKERNIKKIEILKYRRFGRNYLLSLPIRKKLYYILYFFNQQKILNFILNKI